MKKHNLKWLALFGAAMMAFSFASCSSGDDDDDTPANTTADTTYTVVFDADDGVFADDVTGGTLSEDKHTLTATVKHGEEIAKPSSDPTVAADEYGSYEFLYWAKDDAIDEYDFTLRATSDLTLNARYAFVPAVDEDDFADDTADRDGDGVPDGKVNPSESTDALTVQNLHVDRSDSALYFWWDWAEKATSYRATLAIPPASGGTPVVVESRIVTAKNAGGNGEAEFIALENGTEYLFTVAAVGSEAETSASALATPKVEVASPDILLLMYLDETDDLDEVTAGLSKIRKINGYQTVDAAAFRRTADGDAHLIAFDVADSAQKDVSYTWTSELDRKQADDGSYYIADVDFENGAFLTNFINWAGERFTQTSLIAYIEAPIGAQTLASSVQEAATKAGLVGTKKLIDLLVFDGAHDASLESLWAVKDSADYIASSPASQYGINLTDLIASCKTGETAQTIAEQLLKDFSRGTARGDEEWRQIKSFLTDAITEEAFNALEADEQEVALNFYALHTVPSFTVVDTANLDALASSWNELAESISTAGDGNFTISDEESEEETDFLEAVQMLFSDAAILNASGDMVSLYYTGKFADESAWKFDIGYAAAGVKAVADGFIESLPSADTSALADVKTKADAVLTAMQSAVVSSWRDTYTAGSANLYTELTDDGGNAIPCGITITGALTETSDTLTVPTDGNVPTGYAAAFAQSGAEAAYTGWAELLSQWFAN